MIIDSLQNSSYYETIDEKFGKAFNYLRSLKDQEFSPGKYYISGKDIFATISEYETKTEDEVFWEAHKKYIDVQYIFSGVERIGYSKINDLKISQEYSDDLDVVLGYADGCFLTMREDCFMILFPQDAHKPGVVEEEKSSVRKVVIKIRV